jgi:hypothetical protein
MLPRKLHLEQVNRFHDLFEKIDQEIKAENAKPEEEQDKDKLYDLYLNYFNLTTKIWPIADDAIESLKNALDSFEHTMKNP